MKKISVIIPCYYCENMIAVVVDGIKEVFKEMINYTYEIILVNDGSTDGTWDKISAIASTNENVIAVNLSQNYGQHSAMMAGYREATGDYILGLDDDGENNPREIPKLIAKLEEGYDCVVAEYDTHLSKFRSLGTTVNNFMAEYLLDKPKGITLSSYYVVHRFVIDQVIQYHNAYPYISGLFLQATKNWGKVKITREKRIEGSSGYTLRRLISLWLNGFTAFSVKPLRLATALGIVCSMLGGLWGIFLITRKLLGMSIQAGYTSIIACLVFFFGMIMIMLGIIGEYVGRIYISINNAPQYVIKEKVQSKKDYAEN